jgi:ABC-2 type transport system permease protein
MHAKWVLENVAGGYVIPISIYPLWAQNILNFLPFKYLYYVPANIFLGKLSVEDSLQELVKSFLWVTLLLLLSHGFWKKGVKKYSSAGG